MKNKIVINKLLNWRNKYFDSNYELTTADKMIGWMSFFMFGIVIAIPIT